MLTEVVKGTGCFIRTIYLVVHINKLQFKKRGIVYMSEHITKNFIGKVIKVDRDGPESRIGKLLHVGEDYIVILTDDEVVYYNNHHIKSFTENVTSNMTINAEVSKDLEIKKAHNFKGLFKCSQYNWIRINRGGPENVEGLLAGLEDNFAVLVNCQEIIRVALFHIKN